MKITPIGNIEGRRSDAQFAINSVRLSGFALDDVARADFELYVFGKITVQEMRANCLARFAARSLRA